MQSFEDREAALFCLDAIGQVPPLQKPSQPPTQFLQAIIYLSIMSSTSFISSAILKFLIASAGARPDIAQD